MSWYFCIYMMVYNRNICVVSRTEQAGLNWFGKSDLCWCENDTWLHISNVIDGMGSPFTLSEGQQ